MNTEETRSHVALWIATEREEYSDVKYSGDNLGTRIANVESGGWDAELNFIFNYLKRVELFGMDTPRGLRAMGKAAVTVIATLERVLEVRGIDMPCPGVPSGEILEWMNNGR